MPRFYLLLLLSWSVTGLAAPSVILIIGDGMDDHQITIARNYLVGARGKLTLDQMAVRSVSQVLTVSEDNPAQLLYVADSANSGTAMATGELTSRGRIATSAGTDRDIPTIVELAQRAGRRTGLVTTASVTDATAAVFASHISMRYCEDPESMVDVTFLGIELADCSADLVANGGRGSISEQLAQSAVDVILGGGAKHFDLATEQGDRTVLQLAADHGYQLISTAEQLMAPVRADKKLLGLFAASTLPVRWRAAEGRTAEHPGPSWLARVTTYFGSVDMPELMHCEPNPEFAAMPTLQQMTEVALARLHNEQGFFLMVESASIDKQSHERKPCGSIGELQQLNEALDSALDYAAKHPDTLILVTADHGQAAQLIPETSLFSAYGVPTYTPGKLARLQTPEGVVLAINYATSNFFMEEHTGVNVPLFANEVGRDLVPTMVMQADIFHLMRAHLGL